MWEKYVFLTTLAAGTCLMRGPVGRIAATDDGADILRALLRESQAVAAASGHAVRPEADASVLKILTDTSQPMTASMFRDLSQGLPVGADHIVGDMVRRAATLAWTRPICAWPTRICRSIRRSARRADAAAAAPLFAPPPGAHCSHAPRAVRGAGRRRIRRHWCADCKELVRSGGFFPSIRPNSMVLPEPRRGLRTVRKASAPGSY